MDSTTRATFYPDADLHRALRGIPRQHVRRIPARIVVEAIRVGHRSSVYR